MLASELWLSVRLTWLVLTPREFRGAPQPAAVPLTTQKVTPEGQAPRGALT